MCCHSTNSCTRFRSVQPTPISLFLDSISGTDSTKSIRQADQAAAKARQYTTKHASMLAGAGAAQVLQCVAVCCCAAARYSVVQCIAACRGVLPFVAGECKVLQYVAG